MDEHLYMVPKLTKSALFAFQTSCSLLRLRKCSILGFNLGISRDCDYNMNI